VDEAEVEAVVVVAVVESLFPNLPIVYDSAGDSLHWVGSWEHY